MCVRRILNLLLADRFIVTLKRPLCVFDVTSKTLTPNIPEHGTCSYIVAHNVRHLDDIHVSLL